jgi:SAM-dependent methyltransferase
VGNDPYRDWADRYDLFPEDRSEETGFFEKLFSENRVRRVLDCACGTGNELLIFDALDCDVVDSDISDSMLTHARERIDESGAQIPLHRLDYRRLPDKFTEEFDAVVCWSASIVHVTDDEDALKAFQSMRSVLCKGGVLVMDQGITDGLWSDSVRFSLNRSSSEATRLYAVDFLGERKATYHVLDVIHGDHPELKV